jgi:hypothetical protein
MADFCQPALGKFLLNSIGWGGKTAAPMVRQVMEAYFKKKPPESTTSRASDS